MYHLRLFSCTASLPSVSCILTTHEDAFFTWVNAKENVLRLKRRGVVSQHIVSAIQAASDNEAQEILYDHLVSHGTVDTLREWCEWAIAAKGYPEMQELGKKVKDMLPHK